MYKIIALIGEAGSGKDTLMQYLLKKYSDKFNEIISCTTRPKREGEKEGVDYFYLTNEEFAEKVLNYEMLEATSFNDWFYGTSYDTLSKDKLNLGVFNPEGIHILSSHPDIEILTFKINCSDKIRLLRQLKRESDPDVEEIIRRYGTDKKDFSDLEFDYYELKNETKKDLGRAAKEILSILEDIEY